MAEQAEADDVHEEDLDILEPGDADDQGDEDQSGDDNAADEDDEEIVVQFGDEAAPASEGKSEPDLLRTLRAANREQAKELAALRAAHKPKPVVIEVGPRPTLADADVDYDEDKLADAIEAWTKRKSQADEAEAQAAQGAQARQDEFQKELTRFQTAKAALGVRDFEDAKDAVVSVLTQDQISGIVVAAEDAAKVIYALGKHPGKLEALKAITNPVKFIAAVAKLEGTLKVTKTSRKAPELDTPVRGSAPLSSASKDKHEAKLEAKAAQTGNRTELIAYRASLKKRAK